MRDTPSGGMVDLHSKCDSYYVCYFEALCAHVVVTRSSGVHALTLIEGSYSV